MFRSLYKADCTQFKVVIISVNLKIPGFLRIARVVYFSVPTNAVIVAAICWRRFL